MPNLNDSLLIRHPNILIPHLIFKSASKYFAALIFYAFRVVFDCSGYIHNFIIFKTLTVYMQNMYIYLRKRLFITLSFLPFFTSCAGCCVIIFLFCDTNLRRNYTILYVFKALEMDLEFLFGLSVLYTSTFLISTHSLFLHNCTYIVKIR